MLGISNINNIVRGRLRYDTQTMAQMFLQKYID